MNLFAPTPIRLSHSDNSWMERDTVRERCVNQEDKILT